MLCDYEFCLRSHKAHSGEDEEDFTVGCRHCEGGVSYIFFACCKKCSEEKNVCIVCGKRVKGTFEKIVDWFMWRKT